MVIMVISELLRRLRKVEESQKKLVHLRLFSDGGGGVYDGQTELTDFGNLGELFDVLEDVAAGRLSVPQPKIVGGKLVTET